MKNKIRRSVFVEGRQWYDGANTYYSYRLWVDGSIVHTEGISLGYESAYEYDAIMWLIGSDYVPATFRGSMAWHLKRDLGIDAYCSMKDVKKRDLFKAERKAA